MDRILYQYELNPTTWVYFSAILLVALFFKFSRLWSIRNLDLLGLIAMSPGLLLVAHGRQIGGDEGAGMEGWGFLWLAGVGLFFLIRLIVDLLLVRRPLLEPNMTAGGLGFLASAMFFFLMASVITARLDPPAETAAKPQPEDTPQEGAETGAEEGTQEGEEEGAEKDADAKPEEARPGFALLDKLPNIPSQAFANGRHSGEAVRDVTARAIAVFSHLALVVGLLFIGYRHFENFWTGIAVATLYLLMPYTAQMVGRVSHVAPAALLVWVIASYRRPLICGLLLGVAVGLIYYPLFLLPLFTAFYWQRGLLRFTLGWIATVAALAVTVAIVAPGEFGMIWLHFKQFFGISVIGAEGLWAEFSGFYRLPIAALFTCLAVGMAIWPAQKNLGTLMSCSAALMLGVQFCYPQAGLLFMNWYLPLMLLTIFRPNLEHRVAATLGGGWFQRRKELAQQAA